jgi:hypothetical protein
MGQRSKDGEPRRIHTVIPAQAEIQYAETSRFITTVSGIPDHPLSRMMTPNMT